jgi:hypothetical protein
MAAVQKLDGWFLANDLQRLIDPEGGEPVARRSRSWAIAELVSEGVLEQGNPVTSGRRGKPARQYRVMAKFSDAQTVPAQNGLWSQS